MPLFIKKDISPDVCLGIWKIDESFEDFFSLFPFLNKFRGDIIASYKSNQRRCEILAVRLLIREIIGDNVSLLHEDNGRPILSNGVNIGISHTRGFAVIIVSPSKKVSVDIEYIDSRVVRIKDKFMRSDEQANSLIDYLIHWCTKETLYKLFSDDRLSYNEMQLLSIHGNNLEGIITARNIIRKQDVEVHYSIFNDMLLTYSVL